VPATLDIVRPSASNANHDHANVDGPIRRPSAEHGVDIFTFIDGVIAQKDAYPRGYTALRSTEP
jgi:hypothetical protein